MFGFLSPNGIILIGVVNFPYHSRISFNVSSFMNGGTFESTTFLEGFDKGNTGKKVSLTTSPYSSSSSTIETSLINITSALFILDSDLIFKPPTCSLIAISTSSIEIESSGIHLHLWSRVKREKSLRNSIPARNFALTVVSA